MPLLGSNFRWTTPRPLCRQHGLGKALLYDLHDFRWISNLRFGDQEMEVFGHDHVGTYDEAMRFPSLFENAQK